MKKHFVVIGLIFLFAITGYLVLNKRNIQAQHNNDSLTIFNEITSMDVDVDMDGDKEILKIIQVNGEEIEDNLYEGTFVIQLYDENERLLDELLLNHQINYTLPKDFEIKFNDYNKDGTLDFNIGNPIINDEMEYIYQFYTFEDGKIKKMPFRESERLESCQKAFSNDFKVYSDIFVTYDFDGEAYHYKKYRWEEERFIVVHSIQSPLDYKNIQKNEIIKRLIHILSKADPTDERNLLEKCEEDYKWLLSHSEDTRLYYFMNTGFINTESYHKKYYELEQHILNRVDELKDIKDCFSIFNIEDITSCSLDEIKQLESPLDEDDYVYKEYSWEVNNKTYKVLVGGFDLYDFVFLYNDHGHYLDGRIYLDRGRERLQILQIAFRKKQNYMCVSPIVQGYGTGVYTVGGEWYEVYKDKLLNRMDYLVEGYEAMLGFDYLKKYHLVEEHYNEQSGNYQLTYQLDILSLSSEGNMGIKKTLMFQWDEEEQVFKNKGLNMQDYPVSDLFTQTVEHQILEENYHAMKKLIDDDTIEDKEEKLEYITAFLLHSNQSNVGKRNVLLNELDKWYRAHPEYLWGEELIQKIEQKINE